MHFSLGELVRRGLRLTLAAPVAEGVAPPELPGAQLIALPAPSVRWPRLLPGLTGDALALLLRRPRVLGAALAAFARDLRSPWSDPSEPLRMLRSCLALARLRPDVIHFYSEESAVEFAELAAIWNGPLLTSCRGAIIRVWTRIPRGQPVRARLERALARSSAVHCVSREIAETVQSLEAGAGRIAVIRPGLDIDLYVPPAGGRRTGAELRVFCAGWFRWVKAHEYALMAMRTLLDAGVPARMHVLGGDPPGVLLDPTDRARLSHAVSDLGLEHAVVLEDRAPNHEYRRRLRDSDVLLHTSLSEGIPNVVLEAMASGRPVVTSDCGGVREAVRDGIEGFVVGLRDHTAMADALEQLWREPRLRQCMGQAGRARVKADFSLSGQVDQFLSLYSQLGAAA